MVRDLKSIIEPLLANQQDAGRPIDPRTILHYLPVGVLLCADRAHFPLLVVNTAACRMLGLGERLPQGMQLDDLPMLEYGEPLLSQFRLAVRSGRRVAYDWRMECLPYERHLACDIFPLAGDDGHRQILCTLTDRTAERQAQRNLLHHALHDGLTGLPNRSLFLNKVEEAVARLQAAGGSHCGVLSINLDRFQLVNEAFGHPAGDALLITLANALRRCVRSKDALARLSGDEFAILVTDMNSLEDAMQLADRVHALMAEPRTVGGSEVVMSAGIGVASTLTSAGHAENLIRDAEVAMHQAKGSGRGRTRVFEREIHGGGVGQIHVEAALRRSLDLGELELFYQPIVDLKSGRVVSLEALTRWHHPEHGYISPADFIPIAEDSGLIVPLGRWALTTACKQLKHWHKTRPKYRRLGVNVNLSSVQIGEDDIADAVAQALASSGLAGGHLRLEITESALIDQPERAAEVLRRVKALGPQLALDDFGTGYSSLNYLHRFPIDSLKIDRSFVAQLGSGEQRSKIVSSIMMLAGELGMEVVAEGIEHRHQADALLRLGCGLGQGFLFSRAVPAEDVGSLLDRPARSSD